MASHPLEFLFGQKSAMFDKLSAPTRSNAGRVFITATLAVHFEPGDAEIAKLDALLPGLPKVAEAVETMTERRPVSVTVSTNANVEASVRLREVDAITHEPVDGGAQVSAACEAKKITAIVDVAGVSVAVALRFDVPADKVARLVELLNASRARVAEGEQLALLPAHPDGAVTSVTFEGNARSVTLTSANAGRAKELLGEVSFSTVAP